MPHYSKTTKIMDNNLQTLRKHKLVKPLKSLDIIWILRNFNSISIQNYATKIKLNE